MVYEKPGDIERTSNIEPSRQSQRKARGVVGVVGPVWCDCVIVCCVDMGVWAKGLTMGVRACVACVACGVFAPQKGVPKKRLSQLFFSDWVGVGSIFAVFVMVGSSDLIELSELSCLT